VSSLEPDNAPNFIRGASVLGTQLFRGLKVFLVFASISILLLTNAAVAQGPFPSNADLLQPYSFNLQIVLHRFGKAPYTYQLVLGSLPPGLTMDQSGMITGTATTLGIYPFTVRVTDSSTPPKQETLNYTIKVVLGQDMYGGLKGAPVPGCTQTGYFQVMKVSIANPPSQRWVFASPTCNAFYQRSVYDADRTYILPQIMQQRYNNLTSAWAFHSLERMGGWGFNSIDIYYSLYMLPVGTLNNIPPAQIKVPFTLYYSALKDVLYNYQELGLPEPVKDLCRGFDGNGYHNYCLNMVDVFDPKWQTGNNAELTLQEQLFTSGGFATDPWITAVTLGDSDFVFALKGDGAGSYPHAGMMVATVNFQYSGYQDDTLHSKAAWVTYLQNEYNNDISALNAEWNTGGFYTTFGDAGGFGSGTGVLDEDGRHTAWFGNDYFNQTGMNPNLKADLDGFLYQFTLQAYGVQVSTVKSYDQNHLMLCGTFGGVGEYGTRAPVLQGLKDSGCNIIGEQWNSYNPSIAVAGNRQEYDATGLPAVIWYGSSAQADSDESNYPNNGAPFADYPTQALRGQQYATDQQTILGVTGTNGDSFILGTAFWSLTDNTSEGTNWGLISFSDNAYDGRCAVIQPGKDQYGYPCGGELANYGDFLDSVTKIHSSINFQLFQALQQ